MPETLKLLCMLYIKFNLLEISSDNIFNADAKPWCYAGKRTTYKFEGKTKGNEED